MKVMNEKETREANGGARVYRCWCGRTAGYWSTYWHALTKGCFKQNAYLNSVWKAAKWCFSNAFTNELMRGLNGLAVVGKHAK